MPFDMPFESQIVADFAVIMATAGIITFIFHKIKQPLILGYLIAGIIVGPYSPPFSLIHQPVVLDALAELGVLMLLFGIGLEFPLSKLRKLGLKTYGIIAIIELVMMFGVSFLAGVLLGWKPIDCLFLGAALGSSSTVVIAKVLTGMGKMKDVSTTIMMGVLVVEDLAVVLILSILTAVVGTETVSTTSILLKLGIIVLFLAGALLIGLFAIPRFINWINKTKSGEDYTEQDEVTLLVALGLCFGLAILAEELAGLSMAMGAFLMGIMVAESKVGEHIHHNVSRIKEMFGAVFFVSVGALIDISLFGEFFVPTLVVIFTMLIGKVVGCGLGSRLMGYNWSIACRVGLGLGQIGEFAFIVAKAGQDMGVINDVLFPTIGMAVGVTTFITPYLIRLSYKINPNEWLHHRKQKRANT
ncbi:MAG: cation:proton antiporter [Dehalococcoidia bacterium]|nr:cation:proton antiporter [Dehalococcoidia bacterium]